MWIYVDICGYMWIHVDTCSGVERGGGRGGGAIALGPGPVVGARAKLDFFLCVDRKSVGDPGGGIQG